VGRPAGQALTSGRTDGQDGLWRLEPALLEAECIGTREDLDLHLRANISVDGADPGHLAALGAIEEPEQQVDRLGERGLPDLVGTLNDGHAVRGERDGPIDRPSKAPERDAEDPHRAPPASR